MTWILTHTGQKVDLLRPDPLTLRIEDIAHALANINRFTGHTNQPYSVAQHSIACSTIVDAEYAYDALMHDAAEAYLGDVSSPLKGMLPEYKAIETHFERVLFKHFCVTTPLPAAVKKADLIMLATEKKHLLPEDDTEWEILKGIEPLDGTFPMLSARHAEQAFLQRFEDLRKGRV